MKNIRKQTYTLEQYLKEDRAKTSVVNISPLGLVEITRKRVRDSVTRIISEPCPYCEGRGVIKSKITVCYEIMRQLIIVDGMFGIHPFAIHDVAMTQYGMEGILMNDGPLFQQVIVPFAIAACQEMSAALQTQLAFLGERNGAIGTIDLLFKHHMPAGYLAERPLAQVLVSGLKS